MTNAPPPTARRTAPAFLGACICACLALAGSAPAGGRVIVLGFDGADARTAQELMQKGEMPNFARLAQSGTYAPLGTSTPDESPVAWAALNSGQNPAKTGVPGFMRRELGKRAPRPALGFVQREDRAVADLPVAWTWRLFGGSRPELVVLGSVLVSLALFVLFFAAVLRMRRRAAVGLALVLAAVAGWAARAATRAVPRVIDDVVANPCQTGGFWEVAGPAGVPCVVLEGAMTWDRPPVAGVKLLSGLGVPDVRGENCDWFIYTTRASEIEQAPACRSTDTGGHVFRFHEEGGRCESFLYGPTDLRRIGVLLEERRVLEQRIARGAASDVEHDRLDELATELEQLRPSEQNEEPRLSVPLKAEQLSSGRVRVTIGREAQELAPGGWSRWYSPSFEVSPLVRVSALTRVRVVSAADPLELFVDTLQIDPAHPPFWQPISQPASYSAELARALGEGFETVGWACLTMPFKDKAIDTQLFLEDIQFTHAWRVKLLEAALARDDWTILMNVESTPDRVQHMLYQYYDPLYEPLLSDEKKAEKHKVIEYFGRPTSYADVIPATYREMDAVVGRVLDTYVKPGDTLIVCADHGFQSFRRQVNLNNWLASEGYLALRPELTSEDGDALLYVDWTRTSAYALGLGGIYLNLRGREPGGIVALEERDALLAEITDKLLALEDKGKRAVHDVQRLDRIHNGPHLDLEADLMPGFEAGWRVSWRTTRGGIQLQAQVGSDNWVPSGVFADNKSNWSGDHVSVASALVPGVFLCNRKVEIPPAGIDLLHIAPTVLALVGVPIPAEYDRPPLRFLP